MNENAAPPPRPASPRPASASWLVPVSLGVFALCMLLVLFVYRASSPLAESAPEEVFSAGRSTAYLADLIGDGTPHPTGSEANRRVRDRLLERLRGFGHQPRVQTGWACNERYACAWLENVIVEVEGREDGPAVMLMSHYDSAPASPGAADDLSGVATGVEIARLLAAGEPPRNPVVLLFTDGEEIGLLGPRLFVKDPLASEVAVVVNLEARGSSGPSMMFESSDENLWLMPALEAVPRPVTSSLFETVYSRLPHGTDFSITEDAGIAGLNFAFIETPGFYHSAQDSLQHLSPAALQHMGDSAWGALGALGEMDLAAGPGEGRAVFFDVLAADLVWWPMGWSPLLAFLALALVIAAGVLAIRNGWASARGTSWGLVAWFLAVVVGVGLGFAVPFALGAVGALGGFGLANPLTVLAAVWLGALAAMSLPALLLARPSGAGLWAGVWLGWGAAGVALALIAPGLCYLFVVPALVAGLCAVAVALAGADVEAWAAAGTLPALAVAALLWLPILNKLHLVAGAGLLTPTVVLATLLLTAAAPALAFAGRRWRLGLPAAAAVGVLIALGAAAAGPHQSPETPRLININWVEEGGAAQWRANALGRPLPPSLREAADFGDDRVLDAPWAGWALAYAAPAPAPAPGQGLPAPRLERLGGSGDGEPGVVRLRLGSRRSAARLVLGFPSEAELEEMRVEGEPVPKPEESPFEDGEWTAYFVDAAPEEGVEVEMRFAGEVPSRWLVADITPGLPEGGASLAAARDAVGTAFHEGDRTVVSREVTLGEAGSDPAAEGEAPGPEAAEPGSGEAGAADSAAADSAAREPAP